MKNNDEKRLSFVRSHWVKPLILTKLCVFFLLSLLVSVRAGATSIDDKDTFQQITVSGTIIDAATGQGLVGVTVVVKGTTLGTLTDINGKFNIPLKTKDPVTLRLSSIGYIVQEVTATPGIPVNVALVQEVKAIQEVVVIGYGTQKKVTVTGSVAKIETAQLLAAPVSNISSSLGGRTPGLLVMQRAGDPGADVTTIRIRGVGTFAGSQDALVLIDGIESTTMNDLDPNEVENISVLKDASATAVYGVRGANGVILVTTKRGKQGKPLFSITSNVGMNMFTGMRQRMDGYHWAELYQEQKQYDSFISGTYNPFFTDQDLQLYKDGTDPIWHPNTDWQKLMMRKVAFQQQHNLNISGGTENVKYFVSAGFFTQAGLWNSENTKLFPGFAPNNDTQLRFKRYNIRSNFDFKVTKRLSLVVNISSQFEQRNGPNSGSDIGYAASMIRGLYLANPISMPGVYEGKIVSTTDTRFGVQNQVANFYNSGFVNEFKNYLDGTLRANYVLDYITKGLSLHGTFSYKNYNLNTITYGTAFPQYIATHGFDNKTEFLSTSPIIGNTSVGSSGNKTRFAYTEVGLDYARTFGRHTFTGLVLYNQSQNTDPGLQYVVPSGYQGMVGRVAYDFDTRYLAEFDFGYNGTENFAPGKRFGFFPAYSLGWVLSKEPFFPENNLVSLVKFRGSYGEVGNDKIGGNRFLYRPNSYTYYSQGYYLGLVGSTLSLYQGAQEGKIGNPLVTWERAKKLNIGVDLSLFRDNAIKITFDVFRERRDNILTTLNTVPFASGMTSNLPAVNVGKMQNRGFDGEITYFGKTGYFTYTLSANYTYAVNKIIFQDEVPSPYPYLYRTGQRYGQLYGSINNGLFNSWTEVNDAYRPKNAYNANKLEPGDLNNRDINGDGIFDQYDSAPIGYPNFPGKIFGFSGNLSYKNISLGFLFQGASDVTFNSTNGSWNAGCLSGTQDAPQYLENRWTIERYQSGQPIYFNRADPNNTSLNYKTSTFWAKDASYVRLKNLEIGYTLDSKIRLLRTLGITSFRIYVNASNLFTIAPGMKAFPGVDPENIVTGTNLEAYPVLRVINLGINVNF